MSIKREIRGVVEHLESIQRTLSGIAAEAAIGRFSSANLAFTLDQLNKYDVQDALTKAEYIESIAD